MRLALLLPLVLPLAAHAAGQDFVLANHTGYRIDGIYLSEAGRGQWGDNTLGIDFVRSGERAAVGFDRAEPACVWDLQVEYQDKRRVIWPGLNICDIRQIGLYFDPRSGVTLAYAR